MVQLGYDSVDAIQAWMNHIQQQSLELGLRSVELYEIHSIMG